MSETKVQRPCHFCGGKVEQQRWHWANPSCFKCVPPAEMKPSGFVLMSQAEMDRRVAEARAEGERAGLRRAEADLLWSARLYARHMRDAKGTSGFSSDLVLKSDGEKAVAELFRKMAREVKP